MEQKKFDNQILKQIDLKDVIINKHCKLLQQLNKKNIFNANIKINKRFSLINFPFDSVIL